MERYAPVLLALVALAATGVAVVLSLVSHHAPHAASHAFLSVIVCLTFVGAALVALRHRPYERFGWLLAAVGLSSLLGSLHDANNAVLYTAGVFTANLVFAVLVHTILAFPDGRLRTRTNRTLAIAAYADVLLLQAIGVLFDPLTRWHSAHPRNVALIASHASLATGLEELEAAIAIAIELAVALVLIRRVRAATTPARRQLVPVLYFGSGGLLIFAIGLALAPRSSGAAVVGIGLGLIAALALPIAFVTLIVRGRLSRVAVGELLVELREGVTQPGLEDALRRALGDPALELAELDEAGHYVGAKGKLIVLPAPGDVRVATPIRHEGEKIGVLVHDRSLRLRRELLEAVSAAAGFALANERALETVQRVEHRNRALLDAVPDPMMRVSRDGTYLDVRSDDPTQLLRDPAEYIGNNIRDVLPPELVVRVLACIEQALATGRVSTLEYQVEVGGTVRWKESRMMPSGAGEVVTIVRDVTEQKRNQAEIARLADEQAALRRVATLVAGDAAPEQVFQAATEEVCRLLGIREAVLERYEDNRYLTVVGRFTDDASTGFEVGSVMPIEEGMAAWQVLKTGEPARVDSYANVQGDVAHRAHSLGFHSAIAVPISVAGSTWGVLVVALREEERLPPETERRLEEFARLVALAVASAQAREELAASRVRIIEASDAERRRIERNLHDGAQQRLVALSVALRLIQGKVPDDVAELVELAADDLKEAITELRELAQGIHPAVLTERGLVEALEVLAARTPLPVELDLRMEDRLPASVEAAAYYVVSEALANVVKHAGACTARVRVERLNGYALVEVGDNGAGGADANRGSGLWGLHDRVETLAGRLEVESPEGGGTVVRARLPVK